VSVHISSATTSASAGTYKNTATASATNATSVNASATIVVEAPVLSITKTADATPVSAGTPVGFTITVSNSAAPGTGTATGVTLNDPLPPGTGINWSISPAYGGPGTCAITGAVGSQVLNCSYGNMLPGASAMVHISSPTSLTCSTSLTLKNTATASATNATSVSASATIVVNKPQPPSLSITKTADASPVTAGSQIGFTITVSNSAAAGTGTATGVTLNDPLPAGQGVSWSISPSYGGPGTCTITGSVGSQVLTCTYGNMAPGATASVHIKSGTSSTCNQTLKNTATASATNAPSVSASATIVVQVPSPPKTSLSETAATKTEGSWTTITFTYKESNIGSVGITNVKVSGSYCGTATFVSSSDGSTTTLDPGATWTYTCVKTISTSGSGSITITDNATATGTDAVTGQAAPPETASVTVKIKCGN
jgi:uncharacterized repeat protein (TIGR01451 family)